MSVQGTMFGEPDPVTPKRRSVRDTSIAQYAVAREDFEGRNADVLKWLAHFKNYKRQNPTKAELARFVIGWHGLKTCVRCFELHISRGLTDLQKAGVVQATTVRKCQATERQVHTWRVIPVGRTKPQRAARATSGNVEPPTAEPAGTT